MFEVVAEIEAGEYDEISRRRSLLYVVAELEEGKFDGIPLRRRLVEVVTGLAAAAVATSGSLL